eukprot:scaffold165353_cov29-Tisochrysis_lutea.AAC.1
MEHSRLLPQLRLPARLRLLANMASGAPVPPAHEDDALLCGSRAQKVWPREPRPRRGFGRSSGIWHLGSRMPGFNGELTSFLTLIRALFGDFDIAEIIQVSSGLTNACLFLIYLFVAVFVLLSMFLAILGEAQGSVREQEAQQREAGSDEHDLIEIGLKKMDALRRREAELLLRREGSL